MFRVGRWIASSLSTLVFLYVFFEVPVGGTRTLWQHAQRIMATPEAHDLGTDLRSAGDQVAHRVRTEVIPALAAGPDAGLRHRGTDAGGR